MMNEKDSKAIHDLFYGFHSSDNLGLLKSKLVNYVTTVRKEARAAAFREATSAINSVPMSRYWSDSGEEIARSFRSQVIRRIEAAANSEEGAGDG